MTYLLLSAISRDLISDQPFRRIVETMAPVTIRYFAGPDLRLRPLVKAYNAGKLRLLSAISRDLISDMMAIVGIIGAVVKLLSAISRDLISDTVTPMVGGSVFKLLSAISRDLISDIMAAVSGIVAFVVLLSAISRDLISDT